MKWNEYEMKLDGYEMKWIWNEMECTWNWCLTIMLTLWHREHNLETRKRTQLRFSGDGGTGVWGEADLSYASGFKNIILKTKN
jgi:hypothetical protein